MQEKEQEIAGGSLYYVIQNGKAEITGFHGPASEVNIPDVLDSCPVTRLGKKAFLSKKNLRRVILPWTVEEVGDWAFAYCENLEELQLPEKTIQFGKALFMECGKLKRICAVPLKSKAVTDAMEKSAGKEFTGRAELLAAAVKDFEAYYLLDLPVAGSEEWLGKWDSRLAMALHASDSEGYSKQVLCGEEDYGSTDLTAYINGKRKKKVRLSLLRLLYPEGLAQPLRQELEQYLQAHTKGCESEETWRVIWKEYGNHRAYYSLFAEVGCVNTENLEGILGDIGEDLPEMKAFFLRYREDKLGAQSFFDDLEL